MIKKTSLPVFTFLAVFLAMVLVGVAVFPFLMDALQKHYFELQADINARQARTMAQFVKNRLEQGADKETVLQEFQASIAGTQADRGYVCLVDQESSNYLCHPMTNVLGMSVRMKNAFFDADFDGENLVKWEEEIMAGQSGGGLLHYQENPSEVVYFHALPGMNWTISSHENSERLSAEVNRLKSVLSWGSMLFGLLLAFPISLAVRRVSRTYELQLEAEQEKSEQLLLNVLPPSIAERMKLQEYPIVDHFQEVSVLFCDIAGFTQFSSETEPRKVVDLLNAIFSKFDSICDSHGVEKIKTIGDAYMAVAGVPSENPQHAQAVARVALEMLVGVKALSSSLDVRIGVHCGEVVAGVIGRRKFSYDLWGDTVNIASRLESQGNVGQIHCSKEFKRQAGSSFVFEDCGEVALKGKGMTSTCFLLEERAKKNPDL